MNEEQRKLVVLETQFGALKEQVEKLDGDVRDLKKEIKLELESIRGDLREIKEGLIKDRATVSGAFTGVGKASAVLAAVLSAVVGFIMFVSFMYDKAKAFFTHAVVP